MANAKRGRQPIAAVAPPSSAPKFAAAGRPDVRAATRALAGQSASAAGLSQDLGPGPAKGAAPLRSRSRSVSAPVAAQSLQKRRNLSVIGAVAGGRSAIALDACGRAARMIPPRRNMRRRSPGNKNHATTQGVQQIMQKMSMSRTLVRGQNPSFSSLLASLSKRAEAVKSGMGMVTAPLSTMSPSPGSTINQPPASPEAQIMGAAPPTGPQAGNPALAFESNSSRGRSCVC